MKLKVSVKDGKNCQKIIKVEVSEDKIKQEYDTCFKALIPKAKIPGFRQGKAPKEVVARHYAGEAREQVMKALLNDSYRDAIQEKAIDPLGYPEIADVKFTDQELSYEAIVEVRPKIKLSKVKGLSAKKEKAKVEDKEIEAQLKQLQESMAQFKSVDDKAAEMGDFILADYICTVDGNEIEKRQGDMFELKEEEFLKGMSKQLVGAKLNEERDVKVTFPKDMGKPELAGKEAIFKLTVKEVKIKNVPAIDDELAKDAGDCDTLAELKDKIKKELLHSKEHQIEHAYEKALLEELVKKNKLDLPAKVVQRRAEHLVEQTKNNYLRSGLTEEQFEGMKAKITEDVQKEAEHQVHVAFLLDEIANKENIQVTEEDMAAQIEKVAEKYRQPLETVQKYYTESPEALENIRDEVRSKKTIDFIKQNAKS